MGNSVGPQYVQTRSYTFFVSLMITYDQHNHNHKKMIDHFLLNMIMALTLTIQKFGFINGVDNVNWPPYRDSKSF